jgi:hypothetical protein
MLVAIKLCGITFWETVIFPNGMIYCYIFWNEGIIPVLELIQEIVDESVL